MWQSIRTRLMAIGVLVALVVTVFSVLQMQRRVRGYEATMTRLDSGTRNLAVLKDTTLAFKTIRVELRDFLLDPARRETYAGRVVNLIGELNAGVAELEKYAPTPEINSTLTELKNSLLVFYDVGGRILAFGTARNFSAALQVLLTECQPAADAVIGHLESLHAEYEAYAAAVSSDFAAQTATSARMTLLTTLLGLLMLGALIVYVVKAILTPIIVIKGAMSKLAEGDLSVPYQPLNDKGEIGDLSRAVGDAFVSLRTLILQMQSSAKVVAEKAGRILGQVSEVAEGNTSQSSITSEILRSLEQLSAATEEIAANAQTAANAGAKASSVALLGSQKVATSLGSLHKVQESVASLASVSKQISGIVETIDGVSDQTNILALNAAIEAARAGEQGRGFAVVADAVRRLAEQSMSATKEITKLVDDIQVRLAQAIATSKQGAEGAQGAQAGIDGIIAEINGMAAMIEGISAAGEQQAAGATEVTASMQNLTAITQEVAAASQTTTRDAQELRDVAKALSTATAAFKL